MVTSRQLYVYSREQVPAGVSVDKKPVFKNSTEPDSDVA